MASNFTEWSLQLINSRTGRPYTGMNPPTSTDDTGTCAVLTQGSPASATIYSDDVGTTTTSPITFTGGRIRFFTANSVTALDLSILTADGHARFMANVLPSDQHIYIDPEDRTETLILPFTSGNAETDTGFDLPANMLLEAGRQWVRVTTPNGALTLDVGILSTEANGDANGILAAVDLNVTAGATATATANLGALLSGDTSFGAAVLPYRTDGTAKSITYTPSGAGAAGYIYIGYTRGV